MPRISKEVVLKMADLARLELSEEEAETAVQDLSNILDHFASIQNIDTTGVPAADDVTGLINVTREDEPQTEILATHDELIDAAPDKKGRHLKTKSVF